MKIILAFFIAFVSLTAANCQTAEDYFRNGVLKGNSQDHKGAIADYNKAIELDPNYAKAYNNRGVKERPPRP